MPTDLHGPSSSQPDSDHIVIALISEPLVNQVIASDGAELHVDEDINAEIRATDLTNEEELNIFVDEANWDDHVAKLEQSLSSGQSCLHDPPWYYS